MENCSSEMQNYLPTRPNENLSIDFYEPLPPFKGGFKYILSAIDAFSKFVVLYPLTGANTKAVIIKLNKDRFSKYGKPSKIITDHGTQFTSPIWSEFFEQRHVQPIFSPIRHLRSNVVEKYTENHHNFSDILLVRTIAVFSLYILGRIS